MKDVWIELRRRHGGVSQGGAFMHPANELVLSTHPSIEWLRELTKVFHDYNEQLQQQASVLLFLEAVSLCMSEPHLGFVIQSMSEIKAAIDRHVDLAGRLLDNARMLHQCGMGLLAQPVEAAADHCRKRASWLQPHPSDPYIFERRSKRIGDVEQYGFIITMTSRCQSLFRQKMPGIVAIFANVVYNRDDLTAERIRGTLRITPALRGAFAHTNTGERR
jgi:hypothetical protein